MWNTIKFNIQNIKAETAKAVLIRFPNKSKFANFDFWVSKKLVRAGSHSWERTLSFQDDFTFTAKRTGKNFKVLDEKVVGLKELTEAFK